MNNLLYELVEKIFKLQTLSFLIKTVPYVCKKWCFIVYNMPEYKKTKQKLTTNGFLSSRWEIFEVLHDFDRGAKFNIVILNQLLFEKEFGPNIRLMNNYHIIEQLFPTRFESLTHIRVSPSINMHHMDINSLKLCTNITEIDFQGCNITDISPILHLKKIKILKLMFCNNIKNLYVIKYLVSLEELYLQSQYNIYVLPPLKKLKLLYKVVLNYLPSLKDITGLKNLNIRHFEIINCAALVEIDTIATWKHLQRKHI